MVNEAEVKTDVDRLLDLIKESKEISVEDVGKKLNVPSQTVEALADLLEEEGLLHIKYKFTTPYLTSEIPVTGKKEGKKSEAEKEFVFEKEQEDKKKAEAGKVKVEIRKAAPSDIKAGKKEEEKLEVPKPPEREKEKVKVKDEGPEPTDILPGEKMELPEQKEEKKEEEPIKVSVVAGDKGLNAPKGGLGKEKTPASVTQTEEGKEEEEPEEEGKEESPEKITPEPIKNKGDFKIPDTDDIDVLIAKANEFIARGDFESARQIYLKIKKLKFELPKRFVQKEKQVEGGLVDLNEHLLSGMDRALSSDFNKKISEIASLFKQADSYTSDGRVNSLVELGQVESVYMRIKEVYLSLPHGFMEKKVEIQDRMLQMYRLLLSNKKLLLTADFKHKSDNIIKMMHDLVTSLNQRNITEANSIFSRITYLYKNLPRGFLKEKTDLQNKILSLYQKLILSKEDVYSKDVKDKSIEIKRDIAEAVALMNKGKLGRAKTFYKKATDMYSSLPEGFYDVRAELEMKMLDLHHLIVLQQSKASISSLHAKVNEITSLIESANNYIRNREYDLSKEAYKEAISVYNSFPEGFIETNMTVREKVIKLYKDLLSHETMPLIGEADHETIKIYTELLRLLVQIHDNIKKKKFSLIKDKYLLAYKLYHELPLSFLEKKTSIYNEIFKIYEELKLYSQIDKMAEYANNKDYMKLKDVLNLVIDAHQKLVNKYPEDIELFRYIHGKCLIYLDILKGSSQRSGKQVREKIEQHAEERKNPEISKPEELKQHQEKQSDHIEKAMPGIHPAEKYAVIPSAREYLLKKYGIK